MAENPHYKELLQLLNQFEVEYLIVGGYAVMKYGEPRYTERSRRCAQMSASPGPQHRLASPVLKFS